MDTQPPPPLLAASLGVAGAVLVALGALGTWVRVTAVADEALRGEEVRVIVGRAHTAGWLLAAVGVLAAGAALGWLRPEPVRRGIATIAGLVLLAGCVSRVMLIDALTQDLVRRAAAGGVATTYHASFGWGAWMLLVGAVLAALGLLAGWLRTLQPRRGA